MYNAYARNAVNIASGMTVAARTIVARADLAYVRSSMFLTHNKGALGEALAEQAFLKNKLGEMVSGNWVGIAPRTGRQGFDHLFVRLENGRFKWMVCESKFGTSALGCTKSGQQMSWAWIHERAAKLGKIYETLSKLDLGKIKFQQTPWIKSGVRSYDVILEDGRKVTFWKDKEGWHFTGKPEELGRAREMARKMGLDLQSTSCNIRGRKFNIQAMEGTNDVKITLSDIKSSSGSTKVEAVDKVHEIILKDVLGKKITDKELKAQIAEQIKKKCPGLSDQEIQELADDFCDKYKNGSLVKQALSLSGGIALQSGIAGVIAGGMDAVIQLVAKREVNWKHVGLIAIGTASGTAVGQSLSIVFVKTKSGAQFVRFVSRSVGLKSASFVRNSMGGGVGGVVTSAIVAYASVWLGMSDWKTANREFAAGVLGTVGGAGVGVGVTSLVAAFGAAGTGAPIASLSGAAAWNATLAWLGGGTIASGGGGVAAGALVLGGIVTVAAVVIGVGVGFAFSWYDNIMDEEYLKLRLAALNTSDRWDKVAAYRLGA